MSAEEIFKVIGFIVFALAIIYYFGKCMSFQTSIIEGLENADTDNKPDTVANKTPGGIGANAATYLAGIKSLTVKLHDELLIDKYKSDYEAIVLATDDLISMIMVKSLLELKVDPTKPGSGLAMIIECKAGKEALNDVMKIIDKA